MPRHDLPLQTFRTLALSRSPPRLTPAYLLQAPQISAVCIRRTFARSSPAQAFTATSRSLDKYIPDRLARAAWPYLYKQFDKMPHLDSYFKQVDSLQDTFIERLREAVAIPSISSEDKRRPDVVKVCS